MKVRGSFLGKVIERIAPAEPFRFSVSKFRTYIFSLLIILGVLFFYLREQNRDELDLLKKEHERIQSVIQNYFDEMSYNRMDRSKTVPISEKISFYKKQLLIIEKDISTMKNIWLLE